MQSKKPEVFRKPWRVSWLACALLSGLIGCGGEDGESEGVDLDQEDPLFSKFWHLENRGEEGSLLGADVKAVGAWKAGATGKGITIAVIDESVDLQHEDLKDRLRIVPDSYIGMPSATSPQGDLRWEHHGTAVAGLAGATGKNGIGGRGVAFESSLIPYNMGEANLTSSTMGQAFRSAAGHGADILTNSWGLSRGVAVLPDTLRAAFEAVNTTGRGGKGSLLLFAAGNGNSLMLDEIATNPLVLAIGASTDSDVRASFSSFGPHLDLVAPSSSANKGIWTSDVTGRRGYNVGAFGPGDYRVGVVARSTDRPYELHFDTASVPVAEVEPNDRMSQAQVVDPAARVSARMERGATAPETPGIWDWFAVTVPSGKKLRAYLVGDVEGALVLYDSNGQLVSEPSNLSRALRPLGDDAGNYTNYFSGTSASCPIAAGVAALVLSVNPGLSRAQLIDILQRSADKIDPAGGAYNAQGVSQFYGHGRVNAEKAVQMAKTTAALPNAKPQRWIRAEKPSNGGMYWYSGGKAHGLRLETNEIFVSNQTSSRSNRTPELEAGSQKDQVLARLGATARLIGAGSDAVSYEKALQDRQDTAPAVYSEAGTPVWLDKTVIVGLEPNTSLDALQSLLTRHRIGVIERLGPDEFRLHCPEGALAALRAANAIYESGLVRYAHPDLRLPIQFY